MLFRSGDVGKGVELLQGRLRELGYLKDAESGFGELTVKAVRQFQQRRGLCADGIVGAKTWARLFPPLKPTREYLDGVLYAGRLLSDPLDDIVAAVAAGEGGAFDALQLNQDGAGLSFGILQWAQGPGSLYSLLQACQDAQGDKFVQIFGDGDPGAARDLLPKPGAVEKGSPFGRGSGRCASGWPDGTWTCSGCSGKWPASR